MAQKHKEQQRYRIAQEAARILAESGISDYQMAKRKAAQHLGIHDSRNLPGNQEIEDALLEHHRIFHADAQSNWLQDMRKAALEAMRFFSSFTPRLVGDVLRGSAGRHSGVELHLFADYPEQIAMFLMENHIPYTEHQKHFRFGEERHEYYPVYRFLADDIPVELVVFPESGLRQAPSSKVDGKPMKRADTQAVEMMLKESA
jgi:hypothetical protein